MMARCPFAIWKEISGGVGPYTGSGPYRIIHHTTEGGSAAGAFDAFQANRSDPHFTVDATTIYQHIDTAEAARSLRHLLNEPETNRDYAVQIEVVGYAGQPKDAATLANVARLCRWIEAEHAVPQVWPSGYPNPPADGQDPGGHNRDLNIWQTQGGHYGHCHVPENTHWDPAYTAAEVDIIMAVGGS